MDRRSASPADRGLQTSHQMLRRLKDGHRISLKTQPGSAYPDAPPGHPPQGYSDLHPAEQYHYGSPAPAPAAESYHRPSPASPPYMQHSPQPQAHSPPGYAASPQQHVAGYAASPPPAASTPVPQPEAVTSPSGYAASPHLAQRSGARSISPSRPQKSPNPWADIDGENPNQFRSPLPTWASQGATQPPPRMPSQPPAMVASPPPLEPVERVSPPLRGEASQPAESQASPPRVVQEIHHHHYYPAPGKQDGGAMPKVTAVDEYGPSQSELFFGEQPEGDRPPPIPKRRKGRKSQEPARYAWQQDGELPWHVFNLTGNWVSRPTGEEVIQVRHDQAQNRIVASAVKTAPWSDIRRHQVLEGHIIEIDGIPQVELYHKERPVLRLFPELQEDGALLLLPSRGTVGTAGYWEVTPANAAIPPDRGDTTAVTYEPQSAYAVDEPDGTVINIYT